MADESEQTTIRRQDVEAVTDKLESFVTTLADQEQQVLGWILARAEAAGDPEEPVSGVTPPISRSLLQAAGFEAGTEEAMKSEITVAWKHSFMK